MSTAELGGDITAAGKALLDDANASEQRATLGLGSLALQGDGAKGDITVSNSGSLWTLNTGVISTAQLGGDITAAGKALLDDIDAAAQRNTLGLGSMAVQSSGNVDITGGSIINLNNFNISSGDINALSANTVNITGNIASTSTSTGALVVTGGVGIGGALNVGADSYINDIRIGRGNQNIASNLVVGSGSGSTFASNATNNTIVGTSCGNALTGALSITIFGERCLTATGTSANSATVIGSSSQRFATSAASSVSVGSFTFANTLTTTQSVAIGAEAGRFLSNFSSNLTSASNSIFIGYRASSLSDGNTNQIVIGHQAVGDGSNTTVIGNSSTTSTRIPAGTFTVSSTSATAINTAGGISAVSGTITGSTASTSTSSGALVVTGGVGIGGALYTSFLIINGNELRILNSSTLASAADTGTTGGIRWDADYLYVATAANTWKRVKIRTWPNDELPIAEGGTGANNAAGALANLGIGPFATSDQNTLGTSSTLITNPALVRETLRRLTYAPGGVGTTTAVTNGGGVAVTGYNCFTFNTANSANATAQRHTVTGSTNVLAQAFPYHPRYRINFAIPVAVQWSVCPSFSNQFSWFGMYIGQANNNILTMANQEVSNIGFGITIYPDSTMKISARNATGVVTNTVNLGITNWLNQPTIEIYQVNNGTGTLFTYVNNTLVSTLSGGPTELSDSSISFFSLWAAALVGVASPTVQQSWTLLAPKVFM